MPRLQGIPPKDDIRLRGVVRTGGPRPRRRTKTALLAALGGRGLRTVAGLRFPLLAEHRAPLTRR